MNFLAKIIGGGGGSGTVVPVADGGSGSTTVVITIPTYQATSTGDEAPCAVTLKGIAGIASEGASGEIASGSVKLMYQGVIVDPSCYTLSVDEDGNLIVTFTEEFLKSLPEGVNPFDVLNESDVLIAAIKLTIER